MDHIQKCVADYEDGGYRREDSDKVAVGYEENRKMEEKMRVRFQPDLAFFGLDHERALIFGEINLLYIWSSKLISVYKEVISITGDLNTLSGRVNINLRL